MVSEQFSFRIGIVDQTNAGWAASATYTSMLRYSLSSACVESGANLYFLSHKPKIYSQNGFHAKILPLLSPEYFPGERRIRRLLSLPQKTASFRGELRLRHLLNLPDKSDVFFAAREHEISVLLPLVDVPAWKTHVKAIGWIPDFQHVYLPEFFSEAERKHRNNSIQRLAEKATLIMLSSRNAFDHFAKFVPEYAYKGRVVPFPSLFAFRPALGSAQSTLSRFSLPDKFALVANQFWAHKNHLVVVEAITQLKRSGIQIPVVMTGLPVDHRDPGNQTMSRLLQAIASANLLNQVIILGQVEYADLVQLMRSAAVIIQPSRFEGWSTVVEDAKALGRPLLCSDIELHHEQAPGALGFFPCEAPGALADLLARHWGRLEPGPDQVQEETSLIAEREFARVIGQSLLSICQEACSN